VEYELLKSVFANYTIVFDGHPSSDSKYSLLKHAATLIILAPEVNNQLMLINDRDQMTFLSCGRPAATGFDFSIFVSPYDVITWLLVSTLFTVLGVFISFLNKRCFLRLGICRSLPPYCKY